MDSDDPILKKFQKELNAGSISLVLLALMGRAEKPMYGYQIAKALGRSPGKAGLPAKQGTLYPILRNLAGSGLLDSEVEPSVSGPPRRYYRITDEGRAMLGRWVHAWERTRDFVDAALDGAPMDLETADLGDDDNG